MKPSTDAARLRESAAGSGIVASLAASPLYRERPASAFDLATMPDAEELAAFVQSTQPKEWAKLAKQFPGAEREMLAAQVSALVAKRGTLEVLRNGASFNGINLQLAFFKPSAGGNPEHQARDVGKSNSIAWLAHQLPISAAGTSNRSSTAWWSSPTAVCWTGSCRTRSSSSRRSKAR
ncbi:MAG: hypothetical protein EXS31_15440 [Pedosphaera sp.]|nr:hypothetical protein [Pedosphaera sp.]